MQSTKAVRSIKKLFSGYHEPTFTKQQSHNLLDGLKSSFRNQLDREHGQLPGSAQAVAPANDAGNASPTMQQPPADRQSPASQHFKELLSNPMFRHNREDLKEKMPVVSSDTAAPPRHDPMDVFDRAVSMGMMTISPATGVLKAKRQQLFKSTNPAAAMKECGVASRVLRWLETDQHNLEFLENVPFIKALIPFLVMEGMEDTVWEWFDKMLKNLEGEGRSSNKTRFPLVVLLADLVTHQGGPHGNNNIDKAIASLLYAGDLITSEEMRPQILHASWRKISWLATVDNFKTATASERLYDAHMATSSQFEDGVPVETAHLHLYHPTHPDHVPALALFRDTQLVRSLSQAKPHNQGTEHRITWEKQPWIAILGHDTMNFLLREGRNPEAEHLAELLKSGLSSLPSLSWKLLMGERNGVA